MTSTYDTGLVTYNIELHHFQIGDEININGDKQALIIEFELLSILFDTNILLALQGFEMH